MNPGNPLQSEEKLVDVTGFEPATPCLQSTRVDSNPSIHHFNC